MADPRYPSFAIQRALSRDGAFINSRGVCVPSHKDTFEVLVSNRFLRTRVRSIAIGGTRTAPVGTNRSLTATATYNDARTQVVTNTAQWTSSNTTVATVSATGVVTPRAVGTSTITVRIDGITQTATFTVTAAT